MNYIYLLLFSSLLTFGVSAQNNSLTANVGLLKSKLRVQFEHSLNNNKSTGVNLTYFMDYWKGPRLEGFYRVYINNSSKPHDRNNGFYYQVKIGVGLLTNVFDDEDDLIFTYYDDDCNLSSVELYESNNWINFGASSNYGYKFTTNGGFVFESTIGVQIWSKPWSGPSENFYMGYKPFTVSDFFFRNAGANNYYIVGPGNPLVLQIKFGYNF